MQKQIDLILNGKGGVGKSFFATNFVQYLKDQPTPHTVIDTDNENSTLHRFHAEAQFVSLLKPHELDQLVAAVESVPLVVVDCRAASTDVFLNYFAELTVFDVLKSLDAALTVVAPVNHDVDSVEQVRIIAEAFGDRCQYLVVKNQAFTEDFAIYDTSKTRKRLLKDLAAKEMTMPKLHDRLVTLLQQHNLPVGQAAQSPQFTLMDRQRLKNWQRQFHEQINAVRSFLLPGGP